MNIYKAKAKAKAKYWLLLLLLVFFCIVVPLAFWLIIAGSNTRILPGHVAPLPHLMKQYNSNNKVNQPIHSETKKPIHFNKLKTTEQINNLYGPSFDALPYVSPPPQGAKLSGMALSFVGGKDAAIPADKTRPGVDVNAKSPLSLMSIPATPYILRAGESTENVAQRLGLTLKQLQYFNQFRTFHVPFKQLMQGDEIDIPVSSVIKDIDDTDGKNATSGREGAENKPQRDNDIAQVAGQIQTAASWLESTRNSGAASGMARSMATSAVNDEVQKWLSQFGTVELSLNVDDHFSLINSSLDWLLPVYDTPDGMLYVQSGVRNKDGRNTLNLGWGMRWFTPYWMYGVNNFFDNDMTGNNRRIGLGAEARTDYLKFAANSYLRQTGWHQSRDFTDYNERPADGFDFRATGWLPAYPQLGGKLIYEQYYGKDVALFGKENRQYNPYAVTAGLNWSPFPLLTLGVDKRMGKGGQNDTDFSLQLTWRMGEPLSSQLSSESVNASRLLTSTRYDLVDRNNNIVLEYKKQQLINLRLVPGDITAPGGSTQQEEALIQSRYGLRIINWDTTSLNAAGGQLTPIDSTHFVVTLPAYRMVQYAQAVNRNRKGAQPADTLNRYVISAVAEDMNGNLSNRIMATLTVLPPVLSIDGDVQVIRDNAVADGVQVNTVQVSVGDSNGHTVPGQQVIINTVCNGKPVDKQTAVSDANGHISVDISSTIAGVCKVTVMAGEVSKTTELTFIANSSTASLSNPGAGLIATENHAAANGKDTNSVKATVTDSHGNPVPGITVNFSADNGATIVATGITGADGTVTVQVTSQIAGTSQITASVSSPSGHSRAMTDTAFTADSRTASLTNPGAGLITVEDNAIADDVATNRVEATVTDANGNPVPGAEIEFSADKGATIAAKRITGADGKVSVTLTSHTAGLSTVTAVIARTSKSVGSQATTDTHFIPGTTTASLTSKGAGLVTTVDNAVANGTATDSVKATVTDANGNPVSNITVGFSADNGATIAANGITGTDGTTTMTLTSLKAGQSVVTAYITKSAKGKGSQATTDAHFVANNRTASLTNPGAGLITVEDNAIADDVATNRVEATV
ncbi:hypothetical protein HG548_18840, partial [Citrobacter sp. DNRA3]|uniref:inverse autotransporter beta domain-containing protein n=1 Tax=Citrobacter sp. DNRA3 TaxID=2723054 RepID=UPI00182A7A27